MHTKEELMSLANIGDGAAMEMFDVELGRVLKNIQDRIALTRSEAERMQKDLEQLEILQQQAKDTHTAIQELERSIKRLEVKNG